MSHQNSINPKGDKLMTVADVAAMTQLSEDSIRREVAARRISCIRRGRLIRFSAEHVSQWLERHEVSARDHVRPKRLHF